MIYEGQFLRCEMLDNGIAEVIFDNKSGSVNKFDKATLEELKQVTYKLSSADGVRGVIVTSAKSVFVVGADITEFLGMFKETQEQMIAWCVEANAIFSSFEDLPFPTAAALGGFALGGGMEMALSCDFRIASPAARVGLPETQLGIIPGFGGTTRLPRLIGADNAIEWIATAKPQKPENALKVGAIDSVVAHELLKDTAIQMVTDAADGKLDWKNRKAIKQQPLKLNKLEGLMAFNVAKGVVGAKAMPNYPAPMEAINVIEKAARMSRDEALKVEHEGFVKVCQTSQARAMVQIFLSDQLIKGKAKIAAKTATKQVKQAAVVGAGIMGGGIAYQSASKGIPVVMKDINQPALDLGMNEAIKILSKGVKIGKLKADKMAKIVSTISPTLDYSSIKHSDLVVEAVVENPKIKDIVLQEIESHIADDAILTSNTSTISIDLLATNLKRPENFCGMHFFNPVHKMPLVEIIRGEKTSDETIAATVAYASTMGKSAVVVKDCPGFYVNRVLFPYFRGFSLMMDEGVDFRQVDKVMTKFGWPMGPAYLIDVVGVDTAYHCAGVLAEGFPERMPRVDGDAVAKLFDDNKLGQKTGSGFYTYSLDKKGRPKKDFVEGIFDLIGTPSKEFEAQEIIDRMMLPLIFEVTRCLEEGIVATAEEADMALLFGIGFPPFRGGALKYADEIGLNKIIVMAEKYQPLGACYEVPALLKQLAADNKNFYNA
jgi:3-hydroxyacyl-CoA dehydrogenase/enoyl-CoA hydratase/3-hydroxybutyryl-CoA epimerase/enoyl-CoA isomerase